MDARDASVSLPEPEPLQVPDRETELVEHSPQLRSASVSPLTKEQVA